VIRRQFHNHAHAFILRDKLFAEKPLLGIPFALKLDVPNEVTAAAIEEGRRIASDSNVKGYTNMDDLKEALEV